MPDRFNIGDIIRFSGQIGIKRKGTIDKIWTSPKGILFCHARSHPIYAWEKEPVFFTVCLNPTYYNHPFCVIEF